MVINFLSLLLFQPPTYIESDICHVIKTNGQPIRRKVRRLSPEMTKIAKEEIDKYWMRRSFDPEPARGDHPYTWSKRSNQVSIV